APQGYGQAPPWQGQPQGHGNASPMHGNAPPMHGNAPPMHGNASPMHGNASPMHGNVPPMHGNASPMHGNASPMHGNASPMHGNAPPMHGNAPPMHGNAPPMHGNNASPMHGNAPPMHGNAPPMHGNAPPMHGNAWPQASVQSPAPVGYAEAARPQSAVAGCAHAYPLAVRTTGLFAATKLTLKTLPYALFRFGQASLFAAVGALQLCLMAGVAYVLSTYVHAIAGGVVVLAGLVAWALLWLPFVEHKMFASWCGHVAILTELITKGQIGHGQQGMFAFGRELAATKLGDIETVWGAYRSINKALRRLGNVLNFADDLLPIDLGPVKRLLHRVVKWVAPYIEGVIVSYGLARGDRDFKAAGTDGLCYSVQNAKSLFKTAFGVLVLEQIALLPAWVGSLLVFVPSLFYVTYAAMGGDVAALLDGNGAAIQRDVLPFMAAACVGGIVGGAFSLLAVKTVKEAFVKPTLLTMVMVKFHVAIENQPLDPSVQARVFNADAGLAQLDGARAMLRRAGV
ncbi:MAG: hypothetical protein MUF34_06745, partial [Polyangiaceae bacterium]|nr:hypothetical protein [Polyangiaceae bacterium]